MGKSNPTPNFLGNKFCNSHEILLWFKKSKNSKFTFNYHTMKYLNGGKQEKSVWKIPICSGKERLKDKSGNKLHKTQKPIRLLDKIILSSTKKGDTVLDIFSGTATTGASAIKFKRKYIGIEMDKKYIQPSIDRINNIEVSTNKILIDNLLDIKPPQVRVEKLLEKNYINPDEKLYNKEKDIVVQIDKDGKIHINNKKYSIHQAAGYFLNKKRSNGWDYWYVIRNNQLVSIREIRSKYREKELNFKEFNLKEYLKEKRKD